MAAGRRHVWVAVPGGSRLPGLVVAWRRDGDGWQAQVALVRDDAVLLRWVSADRSAAGHRRPLGSGRAGSGAGPPGNARVSSRLPAAQRSSTSRSAASTRRSSSKVSVPELAPRRPGSIAAVCSASTRVSWPSISTSGRKVAGRADVDVGRDEPGRQRQLVGLDDYCVTRRSAHARAHLAACGADRSHHARRRSMSRRIWAASARSCSSAASDSASARRRRSRPLVGRIDQGCPDGAGHGRSVPRQHRQGPRRVLVGTEGDDVGHASIVYYRWYDEHGGLVQRG